MNGIRKEIERTDKLDGFLFVHSASGGAGSALGKTLSEQVHDEFRRESIDYLLFPSQNKKSHSMIVEPYNFMLSYNGLIRTNSIILNYSNQRSQEYLKSKNLWEQNAALS